MSATTVIAALTDRWSCATGPFDVSRKVRPDTNPAGYFKFPQKRWMRRQASSKSSVLVA